MAAVLAELMMAVDVFSLSSSYAAAVAAEAVSASRI